MTNNFKNDITTTASNQEYSPRSVPIVKRTLLGLDGNGKEENPITITTNKIIPTSRSQIASSNITIETFRIGWEDLVSSMPTRDG